MNGIELRLNIVAFAGLFLAAPFSPLGLLVGYYPFALGMGLTALLYAAFLGAQLMFWARHDPASVDCRNRGQKHG